MFVMLQYTILLFGPSATVVGRDRVRIEASERICADDLKGLIAQDYPMLEGQLQVGRLAVNQGFVSGKTLIDADAEVALITMVSGG